MSTSFDDSLSTISSISSVDVSRILKIDFKEIRNFLKVTPEHLLSNIEKAPTNMATKVFERLGSSVRTHDYPDERMSAHIRSAMFHGSVLEMICDGLIDEFNLTETRDLKIYCPTERIVPGLTEKVSPEDEEAKSGVKIVVSHRERSLLTIECKKTSAEDGLKRALLYLKEVQDADVKNGIDRKV